MFFEPDHHPALVRVFVMDFPVELGFIEQNQERFQPFPNRKDETRDVGYGREIAGLDRKQFVVVEEELVATDEDGVGRFICGIVKKFPRTLAHQRCKLIVGYFMQ